MMFPVLTCLLVLQSVLAIERMSEWEECNAEVNNPQGRECAYNTYCDLMMGPSAICRLASPNYYIEPKKTDPFRPAYAMKCNDGYLSRMGTPDSSSNSPCNICAKGYYSEPGAPTSGMGTYIEGTSQFPGNQGCLPCPEGETTTGGGEGYSIDSCSFLGKLPEDWATALAADLPDGWKCNASIPVFVEMIQNTQNDLRSASLMSINLEKQIEMNQEIVQNMASSTAMLYAQLYKSFSSNAKFSEMYDRATGRLQCTFDNQCAQQFELLYARDMLGQETYGGGPHNSTMMSSRPDIACIKDRETDAFGTCRSAPNVYGDNGPIPVCIEECAQTCLNAEATRFNKSYDALLGDFDWRPTTDLCSCLLTCDIDECTTPEDKVKISHWARDVCFTKDPYYVEPPPSNNNLVGSGGNNIQCGLGQFVAYKNVPNMERCADCQPGTFAKAKTTRNKECKQCPRDWVQPNAKQGRCERCSPEKKSNPARTECI